MPDAEAELGDLAARLDRAWRQVATNLPDNPAARIERRNDRDELVLSPLDKVERTPGLIALQPAIAARIPKIDLPDLMLRQPPAPALPTSSPMSASATPASRTLPPPCAVA